MSELRGLGGFRNVLVHGYLEIDERRVYRSLHEELAGFDDFATEIERFLDGLTTLLKLSCTSRW